MPGLGAEAGPNEHGNTDRHQQKRDRPQAESREWFEELAPVAHALAMCLFLFLLLFADGIGARAAAFEFRCGRIGAESCQLFSGFPEFILVLDPNGPAGATLKLDAAGDVFRQQEILEFPGSRFSFEVANLT